MRNVTTKANKWMIGGASPRQSGFAQPSATQGATSVQAAQNVSFHSPTPTVEHPHEPHSDNCNTSHRSNSHDPDRFCSPRRHDDARIDPEIRSFLAKINKDSSPFWELPQPKPQEILTGLESQTHVDMSGVTIAENIITQDGRTVKLFIMKPEHVSGKPGVLLFIHGGVWIAGNFENHQRLLRDLVVGSGQIGVFVEFQDDGRKAIKGRTDAIAVIAALVAGTEASPSGFNNFLKETALPAPKPSAAAVRHI
jgi:hypothetical protein